MNPTEEFLNRIVAAERGDEKGLRKLFRYNYSIRPTSDFSPFTKMVSGIITYCSSKLELQDRFAHLQSRNGFHICQPVELV